jgi:hypothetical protein
MKTLRSRVCKCGAKLLLEVTMEDRRVTEIALPEDESKRTTKFIGGKRDSRKIRTGNYSLVFVYCKGCNRRAQVRTFDTLEEYL